MKKLNVIAVNVLLLCAGLLLTELLFGGWLNAKNKLSALGVLVDYQLHCSVKCLYPGPDTVITYTRDSHGLRGQSAFNAPEKIDVLTMGGSTTDQIYIDDSKTWQEVLEADFKQSGKKNIVSNAGVDGQSSFGHIKDFTNWFPHVPGLKPKYILFYIGINDFYRVTDSSPFDSLAGDSMVGLRDKIENNSAIFNLYRKVSGSVRAKKVGVSSRKVFFEDLQYTTKGIASPELYTLYKKDNLLPFKNRLLKLIRLCGQLGAEPVFATQPSAKYRFVNGQLEGTAQTEEIQGFAYNGVDYFYLVQELNAVIREVAGNKYTVIELSTLPVWENSDFYDYFHMTPKGVAKLGHELFKQLNTKLN